MELYKCLMLSVLVPFGCAVQDAKAPLPKVSPTLNMAKETIVASWGPPNGYESHILEDGARLEVLLYWSSDDAPTTAFVFKDGVLIKWMEER